MDKKIKWEQEALEVLEANKDIWKISDLADQMGLARSTFYFNKLDKSDAIKKALLRNKRYIKRVMRSGWLKSKNATLQLALYKLLADDDELRRLNNKEDNPQDGDGNGILEKLLKANLDIQQKKAKK